MAEIRKFCPKCGCIDLVVPLLVGAKATCPNCTWEGTEDEIMAAGTSEKFYGIEEIGDILIRVGAQHACGPLLSTLQHLGLVDVEDLHRSDSYNAAVQKAQDYVMRSILEAIVVTAFTASGEARAAHPVLMQLDS